MSDFVRSKNNKRIPKYDWESIKECAPRKSRVTYHLLCSCQRINEILVIESKLISIKIFWKRGENTLAEIFPILIVPCLIYQLLISFSQTCHESYAVLYTVLGVLLHFYCTSVHPVQCACSPAYPCLGMGMH